MKLLPIIALVDEDTYAALSTDAAMAPPHDDVLPLMAANGWNMEQLIAGYIIRDAYRRVLSGGDDAGGV